MPDISIAIERVSSPLAATFAISRGAKTSAETVRVTLKSGDVEGRGECVPYARYSETQESVEAEIQAAWAEMGDAPSRELLQSVAKAGAARCALDCAFWDLEAKQSGIPVWKRAGLPEPKPVETAVTVSMASPEDMAEAAKSIQGQLLKLKLGGTDDLARIAAVHKARPDARLIVDANEGLDPKDFPDIARQAAHLGVVLIEQPFPAGNDEALIKRPGPVAICADESAHTSQDIQHLAERYDAVNVKLDKTGGLTEAIAMVREAKSAGMGVMIGCMVAGSISMAPAVLVAGLSDTADVDGPLWLKQDVSNGLTFSDGWVAPPASTLWG